MKFLIVLAAVVAAASCLNIPTEEELANHWETFKATHGKNYPTKVEETFRMKVFKDNAIQVAKHNDLFARGEVTFKVKLNKYSDLHTHEFAAMFNRFRMDMARKGDRVHNASSTSTWSDNKLVDWRTKGAVTAVKDQGQCGSCWSFSTTGSVEGALFKKTGKLVSLSEQNLVDCSSKYGNAGCNGGLMDSAFQYIQANGGINTEESYPYEGVERSCRFKKENNAGTVTGFVDVKANEADLQDAIETVGPVSVAIDASHWSFQHYDSGVYYSWWCSSRNLDHGVLAVGFGSDGKKKDYWIVKNSWGSSWGEQGYIRMARNRKNNCGIATMASYPTV